MKIPAFETDRAVIRLKTLKPQNPPLKSVTTVAVGAPTPGVTNQTLDQSQTGMPVNFPYGKILTEIAKTKNRSPSSDRCEVGSVTARVHLATQL